MKLEKQKHEEDQLLVLFQFLPDLVSQETQTPEATYDTKHTSDTASPSSLTEQLTSYVYL